MSCISYLKWRPSLRSRMGRSCWDYVHKNGSLKKLNTLHNFEICLKGMNEWLNEWIDECFEVVYECVCTCCQCECEWRARASVSSWGCDSAWFVFDSTRPNVRVSDWVSERVRERESEWLSKSIRYSRTANMNWTSTTSTLSTVWLWFVYTMKVLAVLPCCNVAMLHCRMKQSEKKQVKWLMIMLNANANANARINDNELNWTNCQLTRQFERAKQANREWKWALDKQSVWERQRER